MPAGPWSLDQPTRAQLNLSLPAHAVDLALPVSRAEKPSAVMGVGAGYGWHARWSGYRGSKAGRMARRLAAVCAGSERQSWFLPTRTRP